MRDPSLLLSLDAIDKVGSLSRGTSDILASLPANGKSHMSAVGSKEDVDGEVYMRPLVRRRLTRKAASSEGGDAHTRVSPGTTVFSHAASSAQSVSTGNSRGNSASSSSSPPTKDARAGLLELLGGGQSGVACSSQTPNCCATPSTVATPWSARERAHIVNIELENFKHFRKKKLVALTEPVCIVGNNSSGKTSILDALRFLLLRDGDTLEGLKRLIPHASSQATARVTGRFNCQGFGQILLRREVQLCCASKQLDCGYWAAATSSFGEQQTSCDIDEDFVRVSENELHRITAGSYAEWITHGIGWTQGDLVLPQFGLQQNKSAEQLLAHLPMLFAQLPTDPSTASSLVKRRSGRRSAAGATSGNSKGLLGGVRASAELWLARRVDEVYRELTREPLDERMEQWGEGGQASLRRVHDDAGGDQFVLFVSEHRGAAAAGYGTPLTSLSDGAHDVCALALLLTLPGLLAGLRDTPPPFVALDEGEARLDKRHACALWRFLSGPLGPPQSLLLCLNNHGAYTSHATRLDIDES